MVVLCLCAAGIRPISGTWFWICLHCGKSTLISPPPMSSRHRNQEPSERWHATICTIVHLSHSDMDPNKDSDSHITGGFFPKDHHEPFLGMCDTQNGTYIKATCMYVCIKLFTATK